MSRRFATKLPGMRRGSSLSLLSCFMIAALALPFLGQVQNPDEQLALFKEKYDRETDPVHKAKALAKLGDAQIAEFTRQANAGDTDAAFLTLTTYLNEVRSTFDALKTTGIDAEKKPDGFKELQIHLRKTVLKLERAASLVPPDRRKEFQNIHDEISSINSELFYKLFPRQPGRKGS